MSLKVFFFLLFGPFLPHSYKDLPNFSVEDNRAHRLSERVCLKKSLIPYNRGVSVQKRWFYTFLAFLQNGSKDIPNFGMIVEDNRVHRLS